MRIAMVVVLASLLSACSSTESQHPSDVGVDTEVDATAGDASADRDVSTTAMSAYTYYRDVKPIIDGRCLGCHLAGGIGPFALGSYEDVAPIRALISSVVTARTMPPFLPSPGCNEYSYDPSLSDEQIALIADWAAGGAPEGDPADASEPLYPYIPAAPDFDTTLEMPEPYTPQVRPDDYRCFVVDWPFDTPKYITGFGVVPGDARVVHHIIAYYAAPDAVATAEANDAAEDGPGYTCFGGPLIGGEGGQAPWLGSWAPGGTGTKYPAGTGLPMEPGSKVIVQIHYNTLTTDPVPDKTRVQFETADSVDKEAFFHLWASPAWLTGNSMAIPAGDPAVSHSFSLDPTVTTGGRPITLYAAALHMHLLGTAAWTWVDRADGREDCLVRINHYDFGWQGGVGFANPVTIQPGEKLGIECTWDNSMANQPSVGGEQLTPTDRRWGDGTTDEMCLGIYYATVD